MGKFEEPTKRGTALPTDVPKASTAAGEHPDGAIFTSDNGKRYRLRHASWAEVTVRAPKGQKSAAKK
jgi:hypothetical protein